MTEAMYGLEDSTS